MVLLGNLHVGVEVGEDLRGDNLTTVHDTLPLLYDSEGTVDREIFLLAVFFVGHRVDHDIGREHRAEHVGHIAVEGLRSGRTCQTGMIYGVDILECLGGREHVAGIDGLNGIGSVLYVGHAQMTRSPGVNLVVDIGVDYA